MSDEKIRKRVEPFLHAICILFALITASVGVGIDLYQELQLGLVCWIGDYPYLDRAEMESLLAEDDDIWFALEKEGYRESSARASSSTPSSSHDKYERQPRSVKRLASSSEYYDDADDYRPPR